MPVIWLLVIIGTIVLLLFGWRQLDHRADKVEMARLLALQPTAPKRFSSSMVADLPDAARRFFSFAIQEGTPLYSIARLEMEGKFGMGNKQQPGYIPMSASQVLAAPYGFVWAMSGGSGLMQLSGSDSGKWTRFWLAGVMPVARFGSEENHRLSAFGRYVAEAVFWTPAAVLPGPNVRWEAVSDDVARVTMSHDGMEQAVDVTVAKDGKLVSVSFQRWSNANPEKIYQHQPFGGYLSQFRRFDGYHLPTHVEAGNYFGTQAYFPFFMASVKQISFPR